MNSLFNVYNIIIDIIKKNSKLIFKVIFVFLIIILFVYCPFLLEKIILLLFKNDELLNYNFKVEYISCYASILSGVFTVVGVILTIRFERKQKMIDDSIAYKPIMSIYGINKSGSGLMRSATFKLCYRSSFLEKNRDEAAQNFFEQQNENKLDFKLFLKNCGRGETFNAKLGKLEIIDNYSNQHDLSCCTCSEQYIGEILKDEFCIINICLPNYIFVPKDMDDYCLLIIVPITYSDMFNRMKYELIVHINCYVKVISYEESPYERNDDYKYANVYYETGEILPLMNIYSSRERRFVHEEEYINRGKS